MISAGLTHSFHRKSNKLRCSSTVQSQNEASIRQTSLLTTIRLGDGMLHASSYPLSHAHAWRHASAHSRCFQYVISKLNLLSDLSSYLPCLRPNSDHRLIFDTSHNVTQSYPFTGECRIGLLKINPESYIQISNYARKAHEEKSEVMFI